jgi:hypothetical protein
MSSKMREQHQLEAQNNLTAFSRQLSAFSFTNGLLLPKVKLELGTWNLNLELFALFIRGFLQKVVGCVMLGKPLLKK